MMPHFYADTAEALEDVAVSASEALGAFVSFRVYIILFWKLTLKVDDYITVPTYWMRQRTGVPGTAHTTCVGTGGMKFSAVYIFLRITTL